MRPHAELHLSGRAQARRADASRGAGGGGRDGGGTQWPVGHIGERHALAGGTARDGQHGREVDTAIPQPRAARPVCARALSQLSQTIMHDCVSVWRVRDVMARALQVPERNYAHVYKKIFQRGRMTRAPRRRVADTPRTPPCPPLCEHLSHTADLTHCQHIFCTAESRARARDTTRERLPCELCAVKRHFLENLSSDTTESESVCVGSLCVCGKWLCALCVCRQHTQS